MNDIYKEININRDDHYISFVDLDKRGIFNFFSLRPYNFNTSYIDNAYIEKQYRKIEDLLGKKFLKIVKPKQTHTNIVKVLDQNNWDDPFDNVDGLVTNIKDVCLVTSLADCQGIVIYDPKNEVIANIHSGWKGSLNRIGENAIELMKDNYSSKTSQMHIYISPSISKECFEVDFDVKDMFVKAFTDIDILSCIEECKGVKKKYFIDTIRLNCMVFQKLGVKEANIHLANTCTKCNKDQIHSHRGGGKKAGRNILMVSL